MKTRVIYWLVKIKSCLFFKHLSLERLTALSQHFLMALIIDLIVLSIYHHSIPHPQIVTVDLKGLTEVSLKQLASKSLNEKDSLKAIQNYAEQLETLLQEIASQNHWIILPKEAVIKGAQDLTNDITEQLKTVE